MVRRRVRNVSRWSRGRPSGERPPWVTALAASVAGSALALSTLGCRAGSDGDGSAPRASPPATTTGDGPSNAPAPDTADALTTVVVADSEVPVEVVRLLDERPELRVMSTEVHEGWTMAQLDPLVDEALDRQPDVLVYAGGTNDLADGPFRMLDGLTARLAGYRERTCVVVAVPIFRYEPGTDAEVAERTAGTRVLEARVQASGARVASYLDVSIAMAKAGEEFFADGELGELHPGEAAYPRLAAALAEQVEACRASQGP